MFYSLLIWVYSLSNGMITQQPIPPQTNSTVQIEGTCYDIKDANNLKVKVYALFQKEKLYLTESKMDGVFYRFNIQIPDSTKFLLFEYPNFHTAKVAVNFIGKLSSKTKFLVSVPMSSINSAPVEIENKLILCVNSPAKLNYTIKNPDKSTTYIHDLVSNNLHFRSNTGVSMSHDSQLGKYDVVALDKDNRVIYKETFTSLPNFSFKEINIDYPEKPATSTILFDNRNLYFELSSYELDNYNKIVLDSLANFLGEQPYKKVRITGYTEDIGSRSKNIILSEFRAKTVSNYLQQKGIKSERIEATWKGSDVPERVKTNKRVLIEILMQ